jgi:tetratricopeptide (TPR) repeat protein
LASQAATKQKATEHAARGEYHLAIEEYNKILSENDNDAAVHNLVGDTYLKMGNKDQAIDEFERAVEIYTEDAFYSNAVAVCKKILRVDGERASVYENLADLYQKQSLIGEAVQNYKEFADRMKAEGDLEKVFITYQKVKEIMPKKVDTRLALADMYLARNRNDDAVAELREVSKLFREQDKVEEAEEVEQRIMGLGGSLQAPPKVEVAEEPAEVEAEKGEFQDDGDFYQQFQMVPPEAGETASRAATVGQEVEAPPEIEREPVRMEAAPSVKPAESGQGSEIMFEQTTSDLDQERAALAAAEEEEVLVQEKEAEEEPAPAPEGDEELVVQQGEAQYEPMFKSSPTDWASYIELGDLCLSVGSTDEALEYYYKAGDAYFDEKRYDRAGEIYQKIAEIKPLELRPLQRLAQIAQKKGDKKLMIAAYTSLGECLDKRGASKEAEAVYKKLLAIEPQSQLARSKVSAQPEEPIGAIIEQMPVIEAEPVSPPVQKPERRLTVAAEPESPGSSGTISFDDIVAEVTSESLPAGKQAGAEAGHHREGLMSMSELLQEFKEGVEENIPAGDFSSHYDLGITYKEMGLLDEAILEFTKASRGPDMAAKAFEMMGRILLDKKDYKTAIDYLKQGLEAKVAIPEEQIGLYYHLGRAYEASGDMENALHAYLRVKAFDPKFADIGARLEAVGVEAAATKEAAAPKGEEAAPKERPTKKKGKISYV